MKKNTKINGKSFFSSFFKKPEGLDKKWKEKGVVARTSNVFFNFKGLDEKFISVRQRYGFFGSYFKSLFSSLFNFLIFTKDTILMLFGIIKPENEERIKRNDDEIKKIKSSFYFILTINFLLTFAFLFFLYLSGNSIFNFSPFYPLLFACYFYCFVFWKLIKNQRNLK